MPIIKSAKKRVRVARKATVRNAKTKRSLRQAIKSFETSASSKTHAEAQSALDQAGKKGLMHKNKVARKKRQLAAAAKQQGVKVAGTKAAKKTAAKPTAKKAPAKKPVTKKPAAKKAAPKKK